MPTPFPTGGLQYRVLLTGYASPIQLTAATAKTIIISATQAISGLSGGDSVGNAGTVLIGVDEAPTVTQAYVGVPLAPDTIQEFVIVDASRLWVAGLSGDSVVVTILR